MRKHAKEGPVSRTSSEENLVELMGIEQTLYL